MKVVVTGAGGRTGGLIVKKLLSEKDKYSSIKATVRNKKSAGQLLTAGLSDDDTLEFDLAAAAAAAEGEQAAQADANTQRLAEALQGADVLIIATSAVPQIKYASLIGVIAGRLVGRKNMPGFTWKQGQTPEKIDWLGQKVQIDAAKAAGVKQVVLISSMGGTDPSHFLNTMGGQGNILQWKRKAEQYLISTGLNYTIIHPGGLIDEKGGVKQLKLGVDDTLLKNDPRNIPREDVATLAVACIGLPDASKRSFDVIAEPVAAGSSANNDAKALLGALAADCDYSINSQA